MRLGCRAAIKEPLYRSIASLLRNHPRFKDKLILLQLDEVGAIEDSLDLLPYFPAAAATAKDRYYYLWSLLYRAFDLLRWRDSPPHPALAGKRRVFGMLAGKGASLGFVGSGTGASPGRVDHLRLEPLQRKHVEELLQRSQPGKTESVRCRCARGMAPAWE